MNHITTATLQCMAENFRRREALERPLTDDEVSQLIAITRELSTRQGRYVATLSYAIPVNDATQWARAAKWRRSMAQLQLANAELQRAVA